MIIAQETVYKTNDMSDLSIPILQVRHDSAICYEYWTGPRRAPKEYDEYLQAARANAYSGKVSDMVEKRVRKAIDLLLQASPSRIIWNSVSMSYHPFSIGFWTLTISDKKLHPHQEVVKKCLAPFLDWLRYKKALYIWKAELQERGQIHYHLTVNQFIPWTEAAKQWNRSQRKAGYLTDYAKEYGHYNPNSIDVHSVVNLRDIEAYLVKYIVKNDKTGRILKGKVWGCSSSLMGARFATEIDSHILNQIGKYNMKCLEYCTIVEAPGERLLSKSAYQSYYSFIQNISK